ncbi:MAG: sulfatase [Alphaproteobacteria bacterium]|nr:sulfatase [Alphaproteobacteria bacterium]
MALGVLGGTAEVALRASPRFGLGFFEQLTWLTLGVAQNLAVVVGALIVARLAGRVGLRVLGDRPVGMAAAALLALHLGLWYRFERVLNLYARDPQVWGGLLLIAVGAALVGLSLDRLLRRSARFAILGAALAFWAALIRGAPAEPAVGEGTNVLLVTWDTTRPDRLGPYGGPAATPILDRLAAEGVTFEQAVTTAPLTQPAHLSILTGQPTTETGVVVNGTQLGERGAMIQHRMKAAGYTTGAAVSGFPLHSKYGWDQGFDLYDDDFGAIPGLHRLSLTHASEQLLLPGNTLREREGAGATRRARQFIERNADGAWFFWLHLFDPHAPYEALDVADAPTDGPPLDLPGYWPPPHRRITSADWLIHAYDAELARVDGYTGQVIATLERLGLLEDTVVVVTADHGESLTEHGLLFDHGEDLYDPSLRVPLVVRAPGVGQSGARVGCQVSVIDLVPTVEALVGLPPAEAQGRSLVPALRGEGCADTPVVSTAPGERTPDPPIDASVREPPYKLIQYAARPDAPAREALFNLEDDPGELRDISGSPEALGKQRAMKGATEGAPEVQAPELDEGSMDALRVLGYIE